MDINELDPNTITDDDIDSILGEISRGNFDGASVFYEEPEDKTLTVNVPVEPQVEDEENDEDTANAELDGSNVETNLIGDGQQEDNTIASEGEGSVNTPVGKVNDENNVNGQDSGSQGVDPVTQTTTIDQSEYDRYKKFYDSIANAEFIANGKKVKGFTEPEKIIQAQQMAYGFNHKMAGFKKYRPYMTTLQEKGMLDDPEKFNFAMDLIEGDAEAIKAHLKKLNIDPLDIDTETVNYTGKNHVASPQAMVIEDTLETARNYGVEDKLRQVIGKEWDPESFQEFLDVPEIRRDLIDHMATGAFDVVQDKIAEMRALDYSGSFGSLKATDQYRQAVKSLTSDAQRIQQDAMKTAQVAPTSTETVYNNGGNSQLNKNIEAQREAEYQRKLEEKNHQAEEARRRAASVSKKKPSTVKIDKFDPMKLEGDDLDDFVASLIRGK